VRVVVTDRAGNSTTSTVTDRRLDNTPPDAAMTDPGTNLRGAVDLVSTTSDAGAGLAETWYEISPAGADAWTRVDAHLDTTTVHDGLYDLRVAAVDNAGNGFDSPAVRDRRIDNTAPVTTDDADGSAHNGDVTVTLSPSDAGSGVVRTQYRVDGGAWLDGTTV